MKNDENNQNGLENPGSSHRDLKQLSALAALTTTPPAAITAVVNGLAVNQLADMFKALGHPLRIQIVMILIDERMVSMPTLLQNLPGIDPFVLYSNLRFMHSKHLVKKIRKGREIYYCLSETAVRKGFEPFFQHQATLNRLLVEDKLARIHERSAPNETPVFA